MSVPQEKKRKTGGSPGGAQRKRGAEQDLDVPTLGQVAHDARFEPLRELLELVKDTPVNEFLLENSLAAERREEYAAKAEAEGQKDLWRDFLIACYAKLDPTAHKRAHVTSEEHSPEPFVLNDVLPAAENSRRSSLEAEKKEVIPDVPLTSRSRLGPFLKFVNREQSINVLLKHAADQYAKYLRGFREKEAQFAACSGGPGLGKTTFCRKAFSRSVDGSEQDKAKMWEGVDDGFRGIVQDCVEWGRQYRISFGSMHLLHHEPGDPAKSLAFRLMRACGSDPAWDKLPEGRILLPQVVGHLTSSTKESLVVVNLDETNVLMRTQGGEDYLTYVLGVIREINRGRNVGFVYLILSGTNVRPLHDAILKSSSGVAPKEIPLPLLEVNHMQEVLLDLQERRSKQGARSLGQQLDFVLEVLGGVPRYLEMLAFLLGQQGDTFTHEQYCAKLQAPGTEARRLLESVKGLILQQYGNDFAAMLSDVPRLKVVSHSLFGWKVSRDTNMGKHNVGELEARGCVFLTGDEPGAMLHVPLVLLLFMSQGIAQTDPPMLLQHFDVMLSPDQNERASLALLALKSAALQDIHESVHVNHLFPTGEWAERQMTFEGFGISEAESRITTETWPTALSKLQERGAFVVNCKGAPFADMLIVPQGGTFVIFLQEKQREKAKEQLLADRTVPTLKVETVQEEHKKCDVSTPHLFVLITDERFEDFADLKSNEVVLPYDQHGAVMGPLLALLRSFNHSNRRKIAVKSGSGIA